MLCCNVFCYFCRNNKTTSSFDSFCRQKRTILENKHKIMIIISFI